MCYHRALHDHMCTCHPVVSSVVSSAVVDTWSLRPVYSGRLQGDGQHCCSHTEAQQGMLLWQVFEALDCFCFTPNL